MLGNDFGRDCGRFGGIGFGWSGIGCIVFLIKRRSKCRLIRIKKCLRNNHIVIEKKRFRQRWLWVEKIKGYL